MKNSTDLILSISDKEFKDFYTEKLLPVLLSLEHARKAMWHKFSTIAVVNTIIAVPLIIFAFIYFATHGGIESMEGIIAVIVIPFLPTLFAYINFTNEVKKLLDKNIMPTLFSYWGDFKFCQEPLYSSDELTDLYRNLTIFPRYNTIAVDDCIEGSYNGLNVKIVETDTTHVTRTRNGSSVEKVFSGLMLEVSMNKESPLHMVIKTDKGANNVKNIKKLNRVVLEDVEFEKEFEVFANDQIEARYILTPTFMERLTKFKRAKRQKVEVAFYNKKAYFFVWFYEDKFAVPVTKDIVNFSYYQNVLAELAQILGLIDALKLEQKIGL